MRVLFANIMALLFLPIVAILLIISLVLRITACAFISTIPRINRSDVWKFTIEAYSALSNMYE